MYRRSSDGRDQMRRRYDVPTGYGGSRFIRATHGARGLEDKEFARTPSRGERSAHFQSNALLPQSDGPRPDFEMYGNAVEPYRVVDDTREAPSEGSQNETEDGEYRGDPSSVDRLGHDFDANYPEALRQYENESEKEVVDDCKERDQRPGRLAHRDIPFSPEDGDLLLLALLALLCGEEGNAEIVAALALILMVR